MGGAAAAGGGEATGLLATAPAILASPWVWVALAGVDIILSIFGVDPMSLIIGALTGLPDYVKTAQTGQRLGDPSGVREEMFEVMERNTACLEAAPNSLVQALAVRPQRARQTAWNSW